MLDDCKTVLVVDDDADIRDTLSELLSEEGYSVFTAKNGSDALTVLRSPRCGVPCVILLDLMMPVMTGAQFWEEQRRDPALASIPVVVLSADGSVSQKAQKLSADYLAKPVRLDDVLQKLEYHCGKRHQRSELLS